MSSKSSKTTLWAVMIFFIMAFLMVALVFPGGVCFATDEKTGSINLFAGKNGEAFPPLGFRIFLVGEESNSQWQVLEKYSDSGIELSGLSSFEQNEAAKMLSAYLRERGEQSFEQFSGNTGWLRFNGLSRGAYLIVPSGNAVLGERVYTGSPFLVFMPSSLEGEKSWNITVYPKFELKGSETPGDTIEEPPSAPGNTGQAGVTPKTGDTTMLLWYKLLVTLVIAALLLMIADIAARKRHASKATNQDDL